MDLLEQFIQEFGGLTEEYEFYNGSVKLRYDPIDHVYLLVMADGSLLRVNGVTSVCHIIDKSLVLIPWACKMMSQKFLASAEFYKRFDGYHFSTEVLEKLIHDAKSAHKDKLEDAGAVGHIAHSWIELYIKAELAEDAAQVQVLLQSLPSEERAASACKAAIKWMTAHHVQWISTERKIYSIEHNYAGTMDGLCYVDSCDDPFCCPSPFKHRLSIADWKTSNYLYPEYLMQTASYEAAYEEETGENVEDRWVIRLGKEDAKFETWHLESHCFEEDFKAFLAALELKIRFDLLEQRLVDLKDIYRKGKKQQKQDNLKIKCQKSDKYKGIRKPTCGCETCIKKYEDAQIAKSMKLIALKKPKKVKLTHEEIVKNLQNLIKSA